MGIFHQKVYMHNITPTIKMETPCMFTYYHMKIHISLQMFDQNIFEREIALFQWEFFIRMFIFTN